MTGATDQLSSEAVRFGREHCDAFLEHATRTLELTNNYVGRRCASGDAASDGVRTIVTFFTTGTLFVQQGVSRGDKTETETETDRDRERRHGQREKRRRERQDKRREDKRRQDKTRAFSVWSCIFLLM